MIEDICVCVVVVCGALLWCVWAMNSSQKRTVREMLLVAEERERCAKVVMEDIDKGGDEIFNSEVVDLLRNKAAAIRRGAKEER